MERTRTRVAITLGDPAGIGPEISLKAMKAFASDVSGKDFSLVLVGAQPCIKRIANQLDFDVELTDAPDATWPRITVADIDVASAAIEDGVGTATTGLHSYKAVYTAVQMALSGDIDAICTAPLSKEALNAAGYHYSGHTELLAKLTGATDTCMMLVHDGLHVSHMSTHVALSSAAKYVTPERLRRVVGLTDVALRNLGVVSPRIAVCALNPHAGEAGLIGDEDDLVLIPTIAAMKDEGYDVTGPVPGDTVFVKAVAGQFDAVVAMYHDQGHIPVKLLGFSINKQTGVWDSLSGVNITLGLPIVRTSVDHGTAFDIAGQGRANAQSMIEAVAYARKLVMGRKGCEDAAKARSG